MRQVLIEARIVKPINTFSKSLECALVVVICVDCAG